jgi:energy-coupling factor transport system permease protein
MLKDITLGQYFPGNSPVHRLDPRTKILFLIVYIASLFTADNWFSYGTVFAFLALIIIISRILRTIDIF